MKGELTPCPTVPPALCINVPDGRQLVHAYLLYDIKNRHRPLCVLLSTYTHAQLPLPEPVFSFKIDVTK